MFTMVASYVIFELKIWELIRPVIRQEESHYNLRYTSIFVIPPIHNVYHGSELRHI